MLVLLAFELDEDVELDLALEVLALLLVFEELVDETAFELVELVVTLLEEVVLTGFEVERDEDFEVFTKLLAGIV